MYTDSENSDPQNTSKNAKMIDKNKKSKKEVGNPCNNSFKKIILKEFFEQKNKSDLSLEEKIELKVKVA